jgi:hypothetical protein
VAFESGVTLFEAAAAYGPFTDVDIVAEALTRFRGAHPGGRRRHFGEYPILVDRRPRSRRPVAR